MKYTVIVTEDTQFRAIAPKTKSDDIQSETPWQWFGEFKNDPTWGKLFDDIELKRKV